MLFSAVTVLNACGGKSRITVWVYSEEYRAELEDFLTSTPLDLSFEASIRAVNSSDFADELQRAIDSG